MRDDSNVNKNTVAGQALDMWFKPGDQNKQYYTPYHFSSNLVLYPNSDIVQRSDYPRLSMLSLRYRPDIKWFKHTTIALQASNLFTITNFKYAGPESGSIMGTPQPTITLYLPLYFLMKHFFAVFFSLLVLGGCSLQLRQENEYSGPYAITDVQSVREFLSSIYSHYLHYEYEFSVLCDDFVPTAHMNSDGDVRADFCSLSFRWMIILGVRLR